MAFPTYVHPTEPMVICQSFFSQYRFYFAGLLGSGFTTPTDLVKVRLQADGMNKRPRMYRGPIGCALYVYRTQGFTSLYTGATPNMARAVCLTAMQVSLPAVDLVLAA